MAGPQGAGFCEAGHSRHDGNGQSIAGEPQIHQAGHFADIRRDGSARICYRETFMFTFVGKCWRADQPDQPDQPVRTPTRNSICRAGNRLRVGEPLRPGRPTRFP